MIWDIFLENRRSSIAFIDVSFISRADEYFYVEKTGCTVFPINSKDLALLSNSLNKKFGPKKSFDRNLYGYTFLHQDLLDILRVSVLLGDFVFAPP